MKNFNEVLEELKNVFNEEDIEVHEEQDWDNDMGCITIKGVIEIFEPDEESDCWQIYTISNEELEDEDIILNENQVKVLNSIGEEIYDWNGEEMRF